MYATQVEKAVDVEKENKGLKSDRPLIGQSDEEQQKHIHAKIKKFGGSVSGHSNFFKFDDDKLAKPLNPAELKIYTMLPLHEQSLLPFIAKFYGTFKMPEKNGEKEKKPSYQIRTKQIENEFILLEDLTATYKRPCAMDLKLGRKLILDSAPELKKRQRAIKGQTSTAISLGIRMSGFKTYNPLTDEYSHKRRMYLKRLCENGFRKSIYIFFHDGVRLRKEVILHFINRLKILHGILLTANYFDFIASSLLLVYEGYQKEGEEPEIKIDVRLIDFDHALIRSEAAEKDRNMDSGSVHGVESLIRILEEIVAEPSAAEQRQQMQEAANNHTNGINKNQDTNIDEHHMGHTVNHNIPSANVLLQPPTVPVQGPSILTKISSISLHHPIQNLAREMGQSPLPVRAKDRVDVTSSTATSSAPLAAVTHMIQVAAQQ